MQPKELPIICGTYEFDFPLGKMSFFRSGGNAEVLFRPLDQDDLMHFLKSKPNNMPCIVLGNMSNVLVPDEGVKGCVILLSNLNKFSIHDEYIEVEAGLSLQKFIKLCAEKGISSCEKLSCIPGTIGGALAMNAGIPSFEIADVLIDLKIVSNDGLIRTIKPLMSYRNGNIPRNHIILSSRLSYSKKDMWQIYQEISEIKKKRMTSQPIGQATCGSTFKNPQGMKAWELIHNSGCRDMFVGDACVSEKHANFIVNKGSASSKDILDLIELIKNKVLSETGITLEEEIKIL